MTDDAVKQWAMADQLQYGQCVTKMQCMPAAIVCDQKLEIAVLYIKSLFLYSYVYVNMCI